jgi:hypothetical protein
MWSDYWTNVTWKKVSSKNVDQTNVDQTKVTSSVKNAFQNFLELSSKFNANLD